MSRTRLRVGEPLVLTYFLDTQTSVSDIQPKDAPQYAGFWAEDLERPQTRPFGRGRHDRGRELSALPAAAQAAVPDEGGHADAARRELPDRARPPGLLRHRRRSSRRATKPVTITVDPLPDAPGFSGAVGRFTTSADARPRGRAARRGRDAALPGAGHGQPEVDRQGTGAGGARGEGLPAADEERPAHDRRGHHGLAHLGVRGRAGDERARSRSRRWRFSWFDPRRGRDRDDRDEAAHAARGRGHRGGGPAGAAGAPWRRAARAACCPCAPASTRAPRAPALSGRALAAPGRARARAARGALGRRPPADGRCGAARATRPPRARSAPPCAIWSERARTASARSRPRRSIEKALHEAFGEIAEQDESERARAVRAILDEVHFVRYAPQLGDYSDKIRALAARGTDVVRRWA